MKDAVVYDTDDLAVRHQMDKELRLIEALPVVRSVMQLAAVGSKGAGFQARCRKRRTTTEYFS